MMLSKIAWRNVWRSPGRTGTIILAVTVGVASLIFLMGFINGFTASYVDNAINTDYSHIQLHHPKYKDDSEIKYKVENAGQLIASFDEIPHVKAVAGRTLINGMISSAKAASGINIYGVDPVREALISNIDSSMVEGTYFGSIKRNPIVVSTEIAEKLKLKLRSKIVLTIQDEKNEIIAGSFRVDGIFQSTSPRIDKGVVFVRQTDINKLIGGDFKIHEIAILMDALEYEAPLTDSLKSAHQELLVENWSDMAPELALAQGQVMQSMAVMMLIIMGALAFGIVNTMLMAVLERVREIGMLMAVGMKKTRVFKMIVLETVMMVVIGAPLGMIIGYFLNHYFIVNGMDLTAFSEGLREIGYESILYPQANPMDYIVIGTVVGITAVLASIYPARKATKLKPVEALHTI